MMRTAVAALPATAADIRAASAADGDGRDLREEDEENDDNSENAGEEEETYLSDGVEEEDDDSDFGENILNGLEDSAVVEDCSWSVSTVITKEYVLVAQQRQAYLWPILHHNRILRPTLGC
uniref:Uncharacterized protein n=1 Tax=Ananas comosus var. bracteatus TaxID=296719 RepID=A0A6V7PDN0_ANACO|nr:unnamed protein product [Ananas comosus var. bracteatus]